MSYDESYTDWLWKIFVVTDESNVAEEYSSAIVSLLDTLKNPPDVETYSLYSKTMSEKCRKVLFILDESKRTGEESKALHKWLRSLAIDSDRSKKYMVLRVNYDEDEGFVEPLEGLAESQVVKVDGSGNVYTWWPRVIRFLCKTRNWDNSAYILLHAGFGHDITDVNKMVQNINQIEEHKKLLEVMLGPFGPRNLHKVKWNDVVAASVSPKESARDTEDMSNGYATQQNSNPTMDTQRKVIASDEKCRVDQAVSTYISKDPLKQSWADSRCFASVVPVFIILKPDITVAEKCCLTDYAREFPKTHFLCISEDPPSDYLKLLSDNVYGKNEHMQFVFNLLKDMKLISSIKNKSKDSCVCTLL